jgi:hypothetical protein
MSTTLRNPDTNASTMAETPCGARIRVTPTTPYILYSDEIVHFCGWDCKLLYDEDPLSSCLVARLQSGK